MRSALTVHGASRSNTMLVIIFLFLCYLRAIVGLPRCYPYSSPLKPAALEDCLSLIDMVHEGDKVHAPMVFSHDPKRGYKVPHHWSNNTCVLIIDLLDGIDATMKLSEIAFTAATIIALCVGRPGQPHLGGRDLAGPSQKMDVILAGMKKYQEPEPSSLNSSLQLGGRGNSSLSNMDQTA